MSETPSKVKPIDIEEIDGHTYYGTSASVIGEMPMAHITNTRDRACLLKPNLQTMTYPDFTPIDCIYGWSPKSLTTTATQDGTRLHVVTYSMCHCVSVYAYFGKLMPSALLRVRDTE